MLTKLKLCTVVFGVVFTSLQIVQPATKAASTASVDPSRLEKVADVEVASILDRSCKDCHSNQTEWPWYSHIAPVSWIISNHVTRGRAKLNFSDWAAGTQTANQLEEICDAVSDGSMPISGYTLLHRNAKLARHDIDVICDWANTRMARQQPLH